MTTRPAHPPTIGVILAGGAGKRLGGDKALRTLAGATLLDRAIARLRTQCPSLLISVNREAENVQTSALPVVTDTVAGRPGPLGGILAALDHLAQRGDAHWLLSAPVDCPFLPPDLSARLHAERGDAPIAIAQSGGRNHPTVALWHVSLRADLYHALAGEDLHKAGAFVARHPHVAVEWAADPIDPFFNINTPDDLVRAERIAADKNAGQVY